MTALTAERQRRKKSKRQTAERLDCHENTSYFLAMTNDGTATTKDKDNGGGGCRHSNDRQQRNGEEETAFFLYYSSILYFTVLAFIIGNLSISSIAFSIC
jgi:hypothetical protein